MFGSERNFKLILSHNLISLNLINLLLWVDAALADDFGVWLPAVDDCYRNICNRAPFYFAFAVVYCGPKARSAAVVTGEGCFAESWSEINCKFKMSFFKIKSKNCRCLSDYQDLFATEYICGGKKLFLQNYVFDTLFTRNLSFSYNRISVCLG